VRTEKTIKEIVVSHNIMSEKKFDALLKKQFK